MLTITCPQIEKKAYYTKLIFPAGESHIYLSEELLQQHTSVDIEFNFRCEADVFELLLLAHTLWSYGIEVRKLILPYLPFGQADEPRVPGECLSLKLFCLLVNKIVAGETVVYDPHNPTVTRALLDVCTVVPQHEIIAPIIDQIYANAERQFYLVCPDAGAEKKTHKLAERVNPLDIIYCRKTRCVRTGKITGTHVGCDSNLNGADCVITDDQVVGGRTFIEIAKVLRTYNPGRIILVTTNGVFSKGLEVFDGLIDEIYTRKGRFK